MKSALLKDFIREIKRNKGRFLSIFFIVLLGSSFFAGVRSSGGDMRYTADVYYDDLDMMDIRIISALGLTDEDLEDIEALDLVDKACGGYTKDVLLSVGSDEYVIKLIAETEEINKPEIKEGHAPESISECAADSLFMESAGLSLGDEVEVYLRGEDDDINDCLKRTCFTITGSVNLPYYTDLTRGTSSVGSGSLSGFLIVSPDVFDSEIYSEIYAVVAGAKQLNTYSDEYGSLVNDAVREIENISEDTAQRRYDDICSEYSEKLDSGQSEIDDAEKELADAKSELTDGWNELEDAKIELENAKLKIEEGKTELESAKAELDSAKAELDFSESELDTYGKELESAKQILDETESELGMYKSELDAAKEELDQAESALLQLKEGLDSAKEEIDKNEALLAESQKRIEYTKSEIVSGEEMINEQGEKLEEAENQLESLESVYNGKLPELEEAKNNYDKYSNYYQQILEELKSDPQNEKLEQEAADLKERLDELERIIGEGDAMKAQIETLKNMIDSGKAEIEEKKAEIESYKAKIALAEEEYNASAAALQAGKEEYEAGLAQYGSAKDEYEAGLSRYNEGKQKYDEGLSEFENGKSEYEEGLEQYNTGLAEWEKGLEEYEEGLARYSSAKEEFESSYAQYEEGLAKYEEGLAAWEEGNNEYNESYEDAESEIADAQGEIDDLRAQLDSLEVPKWYIFDRDDISSFASYRSTADSMDSVGGVFPVIFFLVAALVSLTAMTRMVEEQRSQIGTLKALGYGRRHIAAKYIGYALLATLGGSVTGVFIGEYILPKIIMTAYSMLFVGITQYYMPVNFIQAPLAVIISAACTCLSALYASWEILKNNPAYLMRPETPRDGKRVLLERFPAFWNRLNFNKKAAARNLFRYKKRFVMTLAGISGCMGLLIVGFGMNDSILTVAKNQYTEIFTEDASVTLNTDEDIFPLEEEISSYPQIQESLKVYFMTVKISANGMDKDVYLYVPEDTDVFLDFVRFRDRVTEEFYDFPKNGIALTEKMAGMLSVSAGDSVTLRKGEDSVPVKVNVETVVENYVQHYVFMSPEVYRKTFGELPEYNGILLKYDDNSASYEEKLGNALIGYDSCLGVSFTSDLESQINDTLDSLNLVIMVLVVFAALLNFVVLYNLNSINMTERKRELATLKVLGFYDTEVAFYIYRENIVLTLMGIAFGAAIGKIIHLFTITTIEIDLMMYGRALSLKSYLVSAALTFVFSCFVNYIMYYHFRKIEMVESMKSVE